MQRTPTGARRDEAALVERLRAGDEDAFRELVGRHDAALRRVARLYLRTPAQAEEAVAETWLAVLTGIERFEGRSSLRTWIFRILANRARERAVREARSVPWSALAPEGDDEPAVDPARFFPPGSPLAGRWSDPPPDVAALPEERLLAREARERIAAAIAALPASQREVITLRDVEGWDASEVCDALGLSEVNQRVLLHRARSRVRAALERYLAG